jgi:PAS domain S-box-containing protein
MGATTDPIHVLHVDDDPGLTDVASEFLEREDDRIDVVTATSAPAGLDTLAEDDVDCVVSDYEMPRMDGLEFLEAIREEYGDLPFILYTGKGSETIASEAISRGVTDYLQKQTDPDQYTLLANRVTNAVERYRSRRELAERKRRLETLVSNLPGMVYRCANEPEWPMEFVGGECEQLTGYPAAELEDDEVLWGEEVLHPADSDEMWATVQDALDAEEPFEVTYRIHDADGNRKWMWERGRGIYEDDELVALEGFITDITDLRERERELQATKERLELTLEAADLGVWDRDLESSELTFDRRWAEMLGYSPAELEPDVETWRSRVHPEDLPRVQAALDDHVEGDRDRYHGEYRMQTSDGEYRWIRSIGSVVERDDDGDPRRIVGVHQNVDDEHFPE